MGQGCLTQLYAACCPAVSACQHLCSCRCLDLLLAFAHKHDQTLQKVLEAGILPVVVNAVKGHIHSMQKDAALQLDAEESADSGGNSDDVTPSPAPTHSAVLAALSLCEVCYPAKEHMLCFQDCQGLISVHIPHELPYIK